METFHGLEWSQLADMGPELTLVIAAVVLSVLDLLLPGRTSRALLGWLTLAAVAIAGVFAALQLNVDAPIDILGQSYRVDGFAALFKLIFLGGTALVVLMSLGSINEENVPHHVGEYYYFYLPATLGALIMASSADLITLFVGLELLSITSYVMVGMRKKQLVSNEGAFKYIVLGGISSAVILYGMSFLYGMTGTTNLMEINAVLQSSADSFGALIYVSFFLLLAGFGFKIAAAPFHNWAPDVYQGAPTPVSAFLAVVSKGAGFALLFRVFYRVYDGVGSSDYPIQYDVLLAIGVLAAAAMIIGNIQALRQTNMKRLFALSGVANAGYLLVPVASYYGLVHYTNASELMFYLIAYTLMNVGAFTALAIVERSGGGEDVKSFAGFYYRAPWTAAGMVVIVLSLAGLPVTGGFFGKLYIMLGATETHKYWLAAIMIATSVISLYYYFGIVRQMFMRSTEDNPIRVPVVLGITLWLCVIGTLVMGFYPQGVLSGIDQVTKLSDWLLLPQ